MKTFVLISAVCLQIGWVYGAGVNSGVGAFSYQDSSGKRYGGTYGLKDGEVVDAKGTFPPDFSPPDFSISDFSEPDFSPPEFSSFNDLDDNTGFFPEYFRTLENLLQDPGFKYYSPIPQIPPIPQIQIPQVPQIPQFIQTYSLDRPVNIPIYNYYDHERAFQSNLENQQLAMNAAHKAFDLTSNQARHHHNNIYSRAGSFDYGFGGFQGSHFPDQFQFRGTPLNPSADGNSAFASGSVGPGFRHQAAHINPGNPNMPNVNKMSRSGGNSGGGYHSVSVSSSSSSSNVNGQQTSRRAATTTIDENGKVSTYTVHSS